ncbi:hypothetical protein ASC77_10975 [Nocardioides sp. Root1257]|uniref:hypothetical protein n=1 Tax=unclassified Nocardioides TaxID=2615069 RepID=UPI0006FBAFD6|nr:MULTISPECIES: hypothetical protein [unclassified Nocardioides]KQW49205.1 hypothetical protein ASC77_10975 [Nocardioides sp. Root1257]KRC48379.1 hypothetical protein ASE24_10980 [Nocardioides sp. Root224]
MRFVVALGSLLAGAATAIATVALHQLVWGLALAVVATAVTVLALPPGWSTRLAFVVGFDAMLGWLTVPRAEGDYLISQNWQGYAVLGFGMVLLVVGVSTLPRPGRSVTDAP